MGNVPSVSIIGLGNVGRALCNAFKTAEVNVESVFTKSDPVTETSRLGDVVLLTVRDDTLNDVIDELSRHAIDLSFKTVAHCSGVHTSGVLAPLKSLGAQVASFHPIMAVTDQTVSFEGIWFDVEGNSDALHQLSVLAAQLNAQTFAVQPGAKPLLHAAAVTASNYMVALVYVASLVAEKGGISEEESIPALLPLMEATLQNMKNQPLPDALTGPIARGDFKTVEKHLQLLENNDGIQEVYTILGKFTAQLAGKDPDSFF
ncbi:MAG: Rossmann-like and DUF2520 domain-containing protein [Bacteroidota bacterium]